MTLWTLLTAFGMTTWAILLFSAKMGNALTPDRQIDDNPLATLVGSETGNNTIWSFRSRIKGDGPYCLEQDHGRIVGGKEVIPGSVPFQIYLKWSNRTHVSFCGGSLLSDRWIVTAAHCVYGRFPEHFVVITGVHNRRHPEPEFAQMSALQEILIHKKYNDRTKENDIALIKLEKRIKIGANWRTRAIRLAEPGWVSSGVATVTGWGNILEDDKKGSDVLLTVDVPLVDHDTCDDIYKKCFNYKIYDNMLCAGGETLKDSCQGDSGGPLVVQDEDGEEILVGIVSWAEGCGRSGIPGVYADVSKVRGWINSRMTHNLNSFN